MAPSYAVQLCTGKKSLWVTVAFAVDLLVAAIGVGWKVDFGMRPEDTLSGRLHEGTITRWSVIWENTFPAM
jgi:hypothetical protein